jgi:hypothetical protein
MEFNMAGEKFSPVATAYLDFIKLKKKELGRLLNGLRIRIEVVQNKYALLFLFCFCINLILLSISNKSLSFHCF